MSKYRIVPITLKEAREFQDLNHRHNVGSKGHKFSIGLECEGALIGCATVGRPIARKLDDGKTAEITRVCVLEGNKNDNSMLYGACYRAAIAMGYQRVITYTLETESGSSLKAAGFAPDAYCKGRKGWDTPSRPREELDRYPKEDKVRWSKGVVN